MSNKIKDYKTFEVKKSKEDEYAFSGWLSKYDNVDRDNDIIQKGAFKDALTKRDKYPLMYQHKQDDLNMLIGTITAYDKSEGVWIEAELDKGDEHAEKVYRHLKSGALQEMSIGFGVKENGYEYNKERGGFDFSKLYMREGSVVVTPANPEATIETVKSDATSQELDKELIAEDSYSISLMLDEDGSRVEEVWTWLVDSETSERKHFKFSGNDEIVLKMDTAVQEILAIVNSNADKNEDDSENKIENEAELKAEMIANISREAAEYRKRVK